MPTQMSEYSPMVEQPHEHSAGDDDDGRRGDDDAGRGPDGWRLPQEPRHPALDDVQTSYRAARYAFRAFSP